VTTGLVKFQDSQDLAPVMGYAELFLKSGFFQDVKSISEAAVKILAGKELGIPPFASMQQLHVVKGKICMAAQLMSALATRGGYTLITEEWTDKVAVIAFYRGDKLLGRSSFTEADARAAGTQNMNRFAKAMLHHRATSQGVRAFTSDAISFPVYTLEEMGASEDSDGNVIAISGEPEPDAPMPTSVIDVTPAAPQEPAKHMAAPPRKSAPIEERIAEGFRLLGISDEQQAEMEEAFGGKTESLLGQIKAMFKAKKAAEAALADAH